MPSTSFGTKEIHGDFWRVENLQMLLDFVLVGGMTLAALMVFFILKTRKRFSGKISAIFFASGFFFALYYYAFMHRSPLLAGIGVIFGHGMGYLLGPTLLFFVRSLSHDKESILRKYLTHLIPYFVHWLLISLPLGLSILFPDFLGTYGQFLPDIADWTNLVENAYLVVYAVLSWKAVRNTEAGIKANFSNLDEKDLGWCRTLIIGIGIIVSFDSLLSVYELIYPPIEVVWNPGLIIAVILILFFVVLGYRGTLQARILLPDFLLEKPSVEEEAVQKQVESVFAQHEASEFKERLVEIMETDKPYLDENLSLGDLAERIDLTDKRLSELLNRHLNTNFYDFVNTYRIEAFKQKLSDVRFENFTLLALAFESGFKSKTSFNRVFKKNTGMSPSEYKRKAEAIMEEARA